jgi:DNA invertase Pin-like site-specific DNA recombinase
MKAVTYCRYSSEQQRATSIADQERNCLRRAEAEGWKVSARFADAAITGSDSTRPEYQRMLAAAMAGEFDVLLVDDLSRFARDSLEQERAIRSLEFRAVRIVSVTDGYDSENRARKVIRAVHGIKNELFLDDLREKVHRGMTGQAIKGRWLGGKPFGYRLRPILDPSRRDAYGQAERIGTELEVDPEQAKVVKQMFESFVAGASAGTIAAELNQWNVTSPGATWRRKVRRCGGWMASAVRSILRNDLYTGKLHWNRSQYLKDPDSGKDRRRARPRSEWVVNQVEDLRIVSDELFERARNRTRVCASSDQRLKSGGKPKHLLSGMLVCAHCGSHYVLHDALSYTCSGHRYGRDCTNAVRVRRETVEAKILGPIHQELLSPGRIAKVAAEMEALYLEQLRQTAAKAEQAPRELEELRARIERLRERLRQGDPDMTADEIQAAIALAETKRQELEREQPAAKATAKVFALVPKAAEIVRRQVREGLDGDPREALKARVFLRGLFVDGKVVLSPGADGSLWASYSLSPAVLLKAGGGVTGYRGRGI